MEVEDHHLLAVVAAALRRTTWRVDQCRTHPFDDVFGKLPATTAA
jgi:hypothetical protein